MKYLSSVEIREEFLSFFERRDHVRISGSSIIPESDPTLLFINSGMAPLKRYFDGSAVPPHPNLCNIQPCIRTRDIDDVGDRHHLTFFEMLGSWSIGNYFKQHAVELAFELLVDVFGFPEEKLFVTVYAGDEELGLEPDRESAEFWRDVGVPERRILFLGKDNFWGPAGETGPCGPCTEVFFDTGDEFGPAYEPNGVFDDTSRYIEIWNAGVFMQLNKDSAGRFTKLPLKSVDTGSGIERMAMMLQQKSSVYETDLLAEIKAAVDSQTGSKLTEAQRRVITDHTRAATMILGESVSPGNEGRAYIPRRLIRKCIALVERAGISQFDYAGLLDVVIDKFKLQYPQLVANEATLKSAYLREVEDFQKVIGRGLERLQHLYDASEDGGIAGKDAFDLFATYGLPFEISREFISDLGGKIDEEGYETEYERHRDISRSGTAKGEPSLKSAAASVGSLGTEFVGPDTLKAESTVVAILQDGKPVEAAGPGEAVDVVLDRTSAYAEGGGQIGDRGLILAPESNVRIAGFNDTQKAGTAFLHRVSAMDTELSVGMRVLVEVDGERRVPTMANHSSTHLLQAALRAVLGDHVSQKGSHVDNERLRFDFTHPSKVTPEELSRIEQWVNRTIRENQLRETMVTSYDDAIERGAIAFSGDTYGEKVSMVSFGDASVELCGGTHVRATGDIGLFRIVSESSVAKGVRRIIAVTGDAAVAWSQEQTRLLNEIADHFRVPQDQVLDRLRELSNNPKNSKKKQESSTGGALSGAEKSAKTLASGVKYLALRHDAKTEALAPEAERLAKAIDGVVVLSGVAGEKVSLVVAVAKSQGLAVHASKLLNALAGHIGGRGGGSPTLARGGGTMPDGVDALLEAVPATLETESCVA